MQSANPATSPRTSALWAVAIVNAVPLVPRETTTSPGSSSSPIAPAALSPAPGATSAPYGVRPAGSAGFSTEGRAMSRPATSPTRSVR